MGFIPPKAVRIDGLCAILRTEQFDRGLTSLGSDELCELALRGPDAASYLAAHFMPRCTNSLASGTSKSLKVWPQQATKTLPWPHLRVQA